MLPVYSLHLAIGVWLGIAIEGLLEFERFCVLVPGEHSRSAYPVLDSTRIGVPLAVAKPEFGIYRICNPYSRNAALNSNHPAPVGTGHVSRELGTVASEIDDERGARA
jgi:hypothetical protein